MRKTLIFIFLALFIFTSSLTSAVTYYVSSTGNDNNPGTSSQPWATFVHAFLSMAGGDTLIVKDGNYTQDIGEWQWSNGVQIPTSYPKPGTAQQKTKITGESIGGVIIDGSLNVINWEYVSVEGFTFLDGGGITNSKYINVRKSGFKGGIGTGSSSYITKEDIWAWEDNRYVISNYRSNHIIDNRVIARLDNLGNVPDLPVGAISHYLTDYSVIANALLFDVTGTFAQPYDLVYSSRPAIGFNKLYGIIGFNAGSQLGGIYPGDGGKGGHEVRNSVIWGTNGRGVQFNSPGPNVVSGNTFSNNNGNAVDGWFDIKVNNNIFYNDGIGGDITSCDNNLFYNSGSLASCRNSDTTTFPDIKYLPRSPISGKGANIEKKYSITLSGNEYLVAETNENLWPWPYEDIIKRDMCAGNAYDWCSTTKTLTEYVWEYLGNPCPSEICYGSSECSKTNILCVDDNSGNYQEYTNIQAASDAAIPGDTVLVYPGSYDGFQVTSSGTSTSRITFKAVDSNVIIDSDSPTGDGIRLQNVNYITIEGFNIQSPSQRCIAARGASPTSPMRNIIIRNNYCSNSGIGYEGFYLSELSRSLIENNSIFNAGSGAGFSRHGIYLANAGSDNTIIRNNIIRNTGSEGIHFNGDLSVGGDGIITGLLIEGNIISGAINNGFSMDGVRDSVIRNNIVYNPGRHALRAYQIDAAKGPYNLSFINNIFLSGSTGWPIKLTDDAGWHTFFNNILLSPNGALVVDNTNFKSNYNIISDGFSLNAESSIISLSSWQSQGYDINSFSATENKLFVDSSSNNYHHLATSPAIDAGIAIFNNLPAPTKDIDKNIRPQGSGYDIGAFEHKVSSSYLPADTNKNGKIEMSELIVFVGRWKNSEVNLGDVMGVLDRWLQGI